MNRRTLLASAGGVTTVLAGGAIWNLTGGDKPDSTTNESTEIPPSVQEVKPLAQSFHEHIRQYFSDARVFIRPETGEIVMEYDPSADSGDELNTQLHQIATEYATVAEDSSVRPPTFSIIADSVQAIVSETVVNAYLDGDINEDAYLETIEVTDVER